MCNLPHDYSFGKMFVLDRNEKPILRVDDRFLFFIRPTGPTPIVGGVPFRKDRNSERRNVRDVNCGQLPDSLEIIPLYRVNLSSNLARLVSSLDANAIEISSGPLKEFRNG